jgi:hypothetical protein
MTTGSSSGVALRHCGLLGWRGANQDGGAGRWPVPYRAVSPPPYLPRFAGEGFSGGGSGWAGGQGLGEWIDRWFADEETEYFADFVWFQL